MASSRPTVMVAAAAARFSADGLLDSGKRKAPGISAVPRSADTISHQGLERWGKHTTVKIADRGPGIGCYPSSCTAGDYTDSCRTPVTAWAKSVARHCPPGANCWLLLARRRRC